MVDANVDGNEFDPVAYRIHEDRIHEDLYTLRERSARSI